MKASEHQIGSAQDRADIRKIEELERLFHSANWQQHEARIAEAFRPKQLPTREVQS